MIRHLVPVAALGLLPATASALPGPPPVWCGPPVFVIVSPPRPLAYDPCWCPPASLAVPTPATPPKPMESKPAEPKPAAPAPPQVKAEPTTPKPKVEAEPAAPPFKPVVPAADKADKPADPPTLPPLVVPTTPAAPTPKPADPVTPKTAAPTPGDPTAPKPLDLKPANPGGPEVPPLVIPPVPKESKTSYRLPATSTATARLAPSAGPAPADPDAPRRVVFVNLSKSAVVLTVAGETAVLPARHELTATVPARFRWSLDGGETRTAEVPLTAPGAEVVIR